MREGCSLLIRNLSLDTSTLTLKKIFEKYGELKDVYIPLDLSTQKARGFAFVEFKKYACANKAKECLSMSTIDGNKISIITAQDRRKSPETMRRILQAQANERNYSRSMREVYDEEVPDIGSINTHNDRYDYYRGARERGPIGEMGRREVNIRGVGGMMDKYDNGGRYDRGRREGGNMYSGKFHGGEESGAGRGGIYGFGGYKSMAVTGGKIYERDKYSKYENERERYNYCKGDYDRGRMIRKEGETAGRYLSRSRSYEKRKRRKDSYSPEYPNRADFYRSRSNDPRYNRRFSDESLLHKRGIRKEKIKDRRKEKVKDGRKERKERESNVCRNVSRSRSYSHNICVNSAYNSNVRTFHNNNNRHREEREREAINKNYIDNSHNSLSIKSEDNHEQRM